MLPSGLNTARDVKHYYDGVYNKFIDSGQYQPFIYPWATVGFGVVLLYLLIDHRNSPSLRSLRLPIFGFLCAFSAWCISTNRARSPAAGYGVGLISAWGTLWTAAIMFFNDCQTDFKRIERADADAIGKMEGKGNGIANGNVTRNSGSESDNTQLGQSQLHATQGPHERQGPFFWQSYPERPFIERLDWVIDVFCNFRGVGWSFVTYGIPPLPASVKASLESKTVVTKEDEPVATSTTGIRRFTDRQALLKLVIIQLVLGFIALDLIKTVMHHDAYFWGYMDASPPTWLPQTFRTSHTLVKSYRLAVSLLGIYVALLEVFSLGPLFFSGLLGPSILGVRGEAWMNIPDFFGTFSAVFDKGLAGWWGSWWHQTFRFAFEAPTTRILRILNIDKRSETGKLISIFTAFLLSGCLHACGSYTQLGETRPFWGPFRFFALQPVGILGQTMLAGWLKRAGGTDKLPKWIRQLMNFIIVHVWMYFTAPLLVDDFAKGGIWLYEPLAFSPLRALGFGAKDDKGWDLWYGLIFWRSGEHWWDTGLAF